MLIFNLKPKAIVRALPGLSAYLQNSTYDGSQPQAEHRRTIQKDEFHGPVAGSL